MIPWYGYTVCHSVPNTNTVPVPVSTCDPITASIPILVPNPTPKLAPLICILLKVASKM